MRKLFIALVVVVVVLVGADFGTRAYAEAQIATQIQKNGFAGRPDVSIAGFPFLTQVVSGKIGQITISAANVPAGPVIITKIDAVLTDVRPNSGFTGGTVGHVRGQAFISFGALSQALTAQAGGLASALAGSGLTLVPVGTNEVRASLNLLITTASATWRITRINGHELHAHLVSSNGVPSSLLTSVADVSIPLTGLPIGLQLQSLVISPAGLTGVLTGGSFKFGS